MIAHYIGLMSGTSVDGIDAVLIALGGPARLELKAAHRTNFPAETRKCIESLMAPGENELERAAVLDAELGALFAEAASGLVKKAELHPEQIRAIGSHGQTLRHHPAGARPYTVQIGNPSVIAERTGITTVADFRARDLAAGGQGAPLVPAFHRWLFHSPQVHRVIVNIGGIANLTYLPPAPDQPVLGFDTGPGNTLMDRWIERHEGAGYDRDGRWAAGGRVSEPLLSDLLEDAYFSRPPPKSTGREHFNLAWLERAIQAAGSAPAARDVQATLVELTARSIAQAVDRHLPRVDEVRVCGGGAHNGRLMDALKQALNGIPVSSTQALGLAPDWVEAAAFAWLAHQTLAGLAGNLPSVTGARHPVILGGIYKA